MVVDAVTPALVAKAAFPVLVAAAKSAATSLWNKIQNRHQIAIPSSSVLAPIADRFEAEILTYAENNFDNITIEKLHDFCASRDFSNFLQQVFIFELSGTNSVEDQALFDSFEAAVRRYGFNENSDVRSLYEVLVRSCKIVYEIAKVPEGELSTATLVQASSLVATKYLESINRQLYRLTQPTSVDFEHIQTQISELASAIGRTYAKIQPQSFDGAEPVPMDGLYVFPTIQADGIDASITSMPELLEHSRIVIVGDPGGGKTTLTSKIAGDIASGKVSIQGISGQILPFVVVLRDFGAKYKENSYSIRDYILHTARSKYSSELNAETLQFLMDSGRAYVIFDGLDELLETQDRRQIAEVIDTFSWMNLSVNVLITSRRIGYSHNPMDSEVFTKMTLGSFSDTQVKKYAKNWFYLQPNLTIDQKEAAADQFFDESSHAKDIRSNPLMLGLMCTLYKRESYIPRNRPDLYEKCSTMLFEAWDKNRGLFTPLRFEAHLKPALAYIANEIYDHQELQAGTTERNLIRIAAEYLKRKAFPVEEESEYAARELVKYCQGRTWVLTEVGTTADSEALYQFSHRTFLEYFAAVHIARTASTVEELCARIIPGISDGNLDVVAELAFQIRTKDIDEAPDRVVELLLEAYQSDHNENSRSIIAQFITRSLSYLAFLPLTVSTIVYMAVDNLRVERDEIYPAVADADAGTSVGADEAEKISALENLSRSMSDVRDQVIQICCSYVKQNIEQADESHANIERWVGLAWKVPSVFGYSPENLDNEMESAPDALVELRQFAVSYMQADLQNSAWAQIGLYYSRNLPMQSLLMLHPVRALAAGPRIPWSKMTYIPPCWFMAAKVFAGAYGLGSEQDVVRAFGDIAVCADYVRNNYPIGIRTAAETADTPVVDVQGLLWRGTERDSATDEKPVREVELTSTQLNDLALIFAIAFELNETVTKELIRSRLGVAHPQIENMLDALSLRSSADQKDAEADQTPMVVGLDDFDDLIVKWVGKEVSLTS